jgi:hypothetical protein
VKLFVWAPTVYCISLCNRISNAQGNSQVPPELPNSAAQNPRQTQQRRTRTTCTESLQVSLGNWRCGVLAEFTARGQSWRNMAGRGAKKVLCVLEFTKTKSIVTVQRRFGTIYHTEPPMDKTFRESYMRFQQSGCLSAVKRTGRPGPSTEIYRASVR